MLFKSPRQVYDVIRPLYKPPSQLYETPGLLKKGTQSNLYMTSEPSMTHPSGPPRTIYEPHPYGLGKPTFNKDTYRSQENRSIHQ